MQNKNILKNQYYFQEKSSKGLPNTTFLKKSSAGFTLVETLVAVSVFVIVMTIATGFFVHVLRSHRKTLAYQEVFSQTSFAMEYMTRGIRMAKKQRTDIDPIACFDVGFIGRNYQFDPTIPDQLRFIRWDHLAPTIIPGVYGNFVCYEFRLNNRALEVSRDGGISFAPLTSPELEVVNLKFIVHGDLINDPGHQYQPKVTIILKVEGEEYADGRRPKVHLQTTVSQRNLDFAL